MTVVPDIYFSPEWGNFYKTKEPGGELQVFETKNEWGHIYYQFIKRPIPIKNGETVHYDTITPYGFGGPVILECAEQKKDELVSLFDEEFQRHCDENKIIAEYTRFNPWLKNHVDFKKIYQIKNRGITLYIDLTGHDFFLEEFSPKARTQVRRAQKNNVEIEFDYTGSSAKEFHRLYEPMAIKNNMGDYYRFTEEFFQLSFHALQGKQFFVNAKYEGKCVGASLVVHHGNYVHYHLTANDPDYTQLAANSLILYEICRWAAENGKKAVHLGGAEPDSTLMRFKKKFTKSDPLELFVGMKNRNETSYNELVAIKKDSAGIADTGYFPLYRG